MRTTIGIFMLFMSIFMLGGVVFIKFEEYAKLGFLKESMLIVGMVAMAALFLLGGI